MSVRLISQIWERAPYSSGVLLVLLALADYANDDGICWPNVESIARKARLGIRQTHKIIADLRRDGVILVEPGGGRGRSSRYTLQLQNMKPNSVNSKSLNLVTLNLPTETLHSSSENGALDGGAIRKNRQEPSKKEPSNKSAHNFIPPTLEQIRDYCEERNNQVNPQQFLNHYQSVGWMRGKSKIKDWRATVRYWEGNGVNNGQQNKAEQRLERNLAAVRAN